jgi:drug/metabolite transporter (DMT)-like permease
MSETTTTPPAPVTMAEPSWAKPSIAFFSLALFAAGLGVAWWAKNDNALAIMLGAVVSNVTTVIQFYYGSSSGSAAKTALLAPTKP